jgi:hypothetical protein
MKCSTPGLDQIKVLPFLILIFPRDTFYLEASTDYLVDFWKHEQSVWVEVTGPEFWATSEVSLDEAKAIIDSLTGARDSATTYQRRCENGTPMRP